MENNKPEFRHEEGRIYMTFGELQFDVTDQLIKEGEDSLFDELLDYRMFVKYGW